MLFKTLVLTSACIWFSASGFAGCLGILREKKSGDLYFLEAQNLYRLDSAKVMSSLISRQITESGNGRLDYRYVVVAVLVVVFGFAIFTNRRRKTSG